MEQSAADVGRQDAVLDRLEWAAADVGTGDGEALRPATPEIMDVLRRLLDRLKEGQLALASGDEELSPAPRIGWL